MASDAASPVTSPVANPVAGAEGPAAVTLAAIPQQRSRPMPALPAGVIGAESVAESVESAGAVEAVAEIATETSAQPSPQPSPQPSVEGSPGASVEPSPAPERVPVYGDPDYDDPWPSPRRQIAIAVRILCVLVIAVLLGHRYLPDVMGAGSLLDTFLPWSFVPLAVAVPAALASRSRWAMGVTALACGVWGADFGPRLLTTGGSGPADLRVLSQNVSSQHPDLAGIARVAQQRGAGLVVLQGLSSADLQQADGAAPREYPYRLTMYEFSVWSKYPLSSSRPVDLAAHSDAGQAVAPAGVTTASSVSGLSGGLLQFTIHLDPAREATVYAVHLPQPSLSHRGFGVARADALAALSTAIRRESDKNLIVVGDLDLAPTDRGMGELVNDDTALVSAQERVGAGFGFTWPSDFPVVRLDDVLSRGLTPVRSTVLGAVGAASAHRPIEVDLRF